MHKILAVLFLTAILAFSQGSRGLTDPPRLRGWAPYTQAKAAVSYEAIDPDCNPNDNLPTQLSSGCYLPRIKVTAHPANPNAIGFFVLVIYKSAVFGILTVQPHFTGECNADGDFVAIFPSGDMTDIIISAVEVEAGELITAAAR